MNEEIINNLKKVVYDIRIEVEGEYSTRKVNLWYSIRNSLVNKERSENNFYYKDDEEKIEELMKKDQMEIFEFLAAKHLEKEKGCGKNPKQFQAPCHLCNQKTLTTYGWSEEGYPNNLERFYCRLCRTSFDWIDIKDDPLELQREMTEYYIVFVEKDIEKGEKRLDKVNEELVDAHDYLVDKRNLLIKLKDKLESNMRGSKVNTRD